MRVNPKPDFYSIASWVVLCLAFAYLLYRLLTFDSYDEFFRTWKQIPVERFSWLFFVFALLPFNLLFESLKWQKVVSHTQKLSLRHSVKSVLAGFSSGFFTPNRTGDFVGRLMFLDKDFRKTGVTLTAVNSLSQNIVIALLGIPAAILFFLYTRQTITMDLKLYLLLLLLFVGFIVVVYFFFPHFSKTRLAIKVSSFLRGIENLTTTDLLLVLLFAVTRYAIFCVQFFCHVAFYGCKSAPLASFIGNSSQLFICYVYAFGCVFRNSCAWFIFLVFCGCIFFADSRNCIIRGSDLGS
jgi:hypothetical protein